MEGTAAAVGRPGVERVEAEEARRVPAFVVLLTAMLLELVFAPLVAPAGGLHAPQVLTAAVLLAAFYVVGLRRSAMVLFALALIALAVEGYSRTEAILASSATLRLVFLSYVMVLIVRHVLRDLNVTVDTIAGAGCAYMLLGMIWADLYALLQHWRPGSFTIPSDWLVGPHHDPRAAFVYFSYVTLTTVGYGDIRPTHVAAGGLCVVEALLGQFYLAVLIARLVGMHAARPKR